MNLYLDVCCLNRPFDDQTQPRIRLEAEAVLMILQQVAAGQARWIGSEVLGLEIEQTPDPDRKERVRLLTSGAQCSVVVGETHVQRAEQLVGVGFHPLDALHIACAEAGGSDMFLTTDDRLLRVARRCVSHLHIRVENPLTWLQETMGI
ncbi:MAG: PIN domain-containing protein [Armatimonadetes bacterium]|nr:PIN domain-containing protein [Armatimonadota bacterium]